jgi:hypothetical protein
LISEAVRKPQHPRNVGIGFYELKLGLGNQPEYDIVILSKAMCVLDS